MSKVSSESEESLSTSTFRGSLTQTAFVYAGMLALAMGVFWLVCRVGSELAAPNGGEAGGSGAAPAASDTLLHILLALAVVITVARVVGTLFGYLGQPPVVGEVVAGVFLGPSLLGRVAPEVSAYLLPASVAPHLGVLAQVGVVLYMFLVGIELDTGLIRRRSHVSLAISHASIVVPFVLGSLLALWLYPLLSLSHVSFAVFALFLGVSMSVTAFPVLARILTDRGLHSTPLGSIALTCAAVDDVTAWCLLAVLVGVVQVQPGQIALTLALAALYLAAIFFLVRPLVRRFVRHHATRGELSGNAWAALFVGLLLSALTTELIGIHALFGAFLLGALIPHDSHLAREIHTKLEAPVVVLLLPAFFAFTGLRTQIGLVHGFEQWVICVVIILVASLGKFGGSAAAARLTGLAWREAASIGVLMNTRGLMELIVLNVGLDLGVLSPTLFAMLVIMALVTTLATAPILYRLADRSPGTGESR